ncbi:ATP-binding protein [Pseudorhodobacter sp.]|uniref:ATP-binding protein n=1 Tax=Pseudorhodobacter sp. TaxID=1934400 RepID=UPI0026470491|nr:ATP-binding protein [Pseudorhodobacter sp.]MDN5787515.1 ATP-binding protein [Pseudorhodobacter sp.]
MTRFEIDSDPFAVRAGVREFLACLKGCGMDATALGTAELVMAEVLNNIVEHAYADFGGTIEVLVHPQGAHVLVEVADRGLPLPCGSLPGRCLPPMDLVDGLPEGGFGWFIIQELASDLAYRRKDGRNHTSFCLPLQTDR